MKTIDDNETFEPAARELAIRFIKQVALRLHESPEVAFDVTSADAVDSKLLFNLCFLGIAQFEEKSGIQVNGRKYTPRVAFDFRNGATKDSLLVGSAQVHGFVDDPEILEAIKRAKSSLE